MIYGFDINAWIWAILPTHLKKGNSVYFLAQALISPLSSLMIMFGLYQFKVNEQMAYNSQKGVLEWALNDRFNVGHNGVFNALNNNIFIEDGTYSLLVYEFQEVEIAEDPFIDQEAETVALELFDMQEAENPPITHYIVNVPNSLGLTLPQVAGYIEKYNPVGKVYTIVTY